MPWRPGTRAQQRAIEAPYEDVPDHLAPPLMSWIDGCFQSEYEFRFERMPDVAIRLRIQVPRAYDAARRELYRLCSEDRGFILDIVEVMLELYGRDGSRSATLDSLLTAANSAYGVRDDARGLELRIVPEVKEQVQSVIDVATGSPGDHLRNAWNEAYGLNPDPTKAYSESIKSVEAAMAPVVSPANLRATLGTIIKDVEAKPEKWIFEIADGRADGVDTVLRMMQVLWDGQSSRHGGVEPTRAETAGEARAAVHLAATLTQFAVGKTFRPA